MTFALYATIWFALALFALGEFGKRAGHPRWAWRVWTLGALAAVAHIPIAFAARHDWSHAAAAEATARRTLDVYGVEWAGGVYVNYLFVALWLAEVGWWGWKPASYARRHRAMTTALRIFYFVIILNAAIVFASPVGRIAGLALVAALIWAWRSNDKGASGQ